MPCVVRGRNWNLLVSMKSSVASSRHCDGALIINDTNLCVPEHVKLKLFHETACRAKCTSICPCKGIPDQVPASEYSAADRTERVGPVRCRGPPGLLLAVGLGAL
jgi:hypothetical protein